MSADGKQKSIKICKSFAERVWAGGEYGGKTLTNGKSQSTYDNCGLNINGDIKIQSLSYKSHQDFFRDVKPPFFEDYNIVLVDGTSDCYNYGMKLTSIFATVILAITIFL